MSWLTLLTGLISLIGELAKYLGNKRLMDAGAAEAIARGQSDVLSSLREIQSSREKLVDPASDRADRLRKRFESPNQ